MISSMQHTHEPSKSGKSLQALILLADTHVYKVATMNTLEEELHLHEKFVEVHKMLRFRDVLYTATMSIISWY